MASYYWIKLYHEILNDPKMGRLSDRTWRRAIELFLLAGDTVNDGMLPSIRDMAWRLHIPPDELKEDLEILAEVDILTLNGDRWHVVNFTKRQAASINAERQRQYRDRQRKAKQYRDESETQEKRESNEGVTKRNADYNDKFAETDTDIESDKETDIPPQKAGADAPPPAPPPKQSKTKRKKTPTPEAVGVFQENAHRYPPKAWYSKIAEAVGEKPADLELWGQVVLAYIGCGWNPGNVKNMLDFYGRREIPGSKGMGKTSEPAGFEGIREWGRRHGVLEEEP